MEHVAAAAPDVDAWLRAAPHMARHAADALRAVMGAATDVLTSATATVGLTSAAATTSTAAATTSTAAATTSTAATVFAPTAGEIGHSGEERVRDLLERVGWECDRRATGAREGDVRARVRLAAGGCNTGPYDLMVEVKRYTKTVPSEQVDKFWRDLECHPECTMAMFVSVGYPIAHVPHRVHFATRNLAGVARAVAFVTIDLAADHAVERLATGRARVVGGVAAFDCARELLALASDVVLSRSRVRTEASRTTRSPRSRTSRTTSRRSPRYAKSCASSTPSTRGARTRSRRASRSSKP